MYNFGYKAMTGRGKIVSGEFIAVDEKDLGKKLLAKGETLIAVKKMRNQFGIVRSFFFRNVSQRLLAEFYIRISESLRLGLSIISILDDNSKSLPAPLNKTCEKLKIFIDSGNPFHVAAAQFPDVFSKMDSSLIRLGELSGRLPSVLKELAEFIQWKANIKSLVQKAMIYPSFMFIVISAILSVWVGYVIPRMANLLVTFNIPLPKITEFTLKTREFVLNHYTTIFSSIFIFLIFLFAFRKTQKGRMVFDTYLLKLPIIGELILNITMARLSGNFATMYASGMMMDEIFNILINKALGNRYIESRLRVVFKEIEQGNSISTSFEMAGTFPQFFVGTIKNGEKSGNLEDAFRRLSRYYNDYVKRIINNLVAAVEPLTLLFLGAVFALVVVSIMFPLYDMVNQVSGKF